MKLKLAQHWTLSRQVAVRELELRIRLALDGRQCAPVIVDSPIDVSAAASAVSGYTELPFRTNLEQEFEQGLGWVRVFLGADAALQLVRKEWMVIGESIYFEDQEPSINVVRRAVIAALRRAQTLGER